ncbi:MAG TPA: right-handed parallel beta-helix repeat-containing protein [Dinghuibacter sp.]|uniref:right-handed parallel beta-helix repeat-containing protein n=1 Tax=Dinghuibacter sp. TaxID=2024697 RepID=UPI002BFAB64D|nr:right-handed parallel beta-helix repeat-containing protein [Dinghuibacter sp.]HTJ13207.1 right-handed parallel beta-helix repeat-containing protein [Dinghuibacter sp.]
MFTSKLTGSVILGALLLTACGKKGASPNGGGGLTPPPTVFYVSPTGNDSHDGSSPSTAWKTIAKVNATPFQTGNMILFEGGQTFAGNLVVSSDGVVLKSYGNGLATIDAGTGTGIYVYNKSNVTIDSLKVTGNWTGSAQSGNQGSGIEFYTDQGGNAQLGSCTVDYCDVSGFQTAGIVFLSGPADGSQSGYAKIEASHNAVHDNGAYGLTCLGNQGKAGSTAYAFPSVYIGYNKVYNNLGISAKTDNHSGDGILVGEAGGGTIEHNVAYNNGWDCGSTSGGPAAIWCYDATNLVFQYNEAYGNGTGAGKADGDGFDLDGGVTHSVVQYNYSHGNAAAGFLVWEYGDTRGHNSGNVVRYNISVGDASGNTAYGGIVTGPGCTGNLFYNNTIYSPNATPVYVYGGNHSAFYNNILETVSGPGVVYCAGDTSVAWFLNNCYWAQGGPTQFSINGATYLYIASVITTGNEMYKGTQYGIGIDPHFSNAGDATTIGTGTPGTLTSYTLQAGSALSAYGIDLAAWFGINVGATDFNGVAIPYAGHYNMGACH